ncbi:hypothetical protein HZS_575 [Henneguya salminicola]|nr:hypothetical protein HZS_575 [Henneguya salminicola]
MQTMILFHNISYLTSVPGNCGFFVRSNNFSNVLKIISQDLHISEESFITIKSYVNNKSIIILIMAINMS